MLPVCSSPALHLNLSLPKNQQKSRPRPDTPARRDALPGKAPASLWAAKWSVNAPKPRIQGFPQNQGSRVFPGHPEPTFGGRWEGQRNTVAPPLDLGPPWHQVPGPRRSQGASQPWACGITLSLPTTSLATVCSCHVPLNGLGPPEQAGTPILTFQPPATRHQPAGSLCDTPAHGQWEDSGTGWTGVFPSGWWVGDV